MFNYTIDEPSMGVLGIPYLLSADPTSESGEDTFYIECPQQLRITHDTFDYSGERITEGETHTFNCSFRGYPLPNVTSDIVWYFTPLANNEDEKPLAPDEYIHIRKQSSFTSLSIRKVRKHHAGTYRCHVRNFLGHGFDDSRKGRLLVENGKPTKAVIGLLIGIIGGVLVLSVLLFAIFMQLKREKMNLPAGTGFQQIFYISHCALNEDEEKTILKFAFLVESFHPGTSVVVDLTRQVEINKVGGLSQWVPVMMRRVDKIIVILTPNYVEAVREKSPVCDASAMKVNAEYQFIQNHLHDSGQVTDKLVLCWLGDKPEKMPSLFEDRCCYGLPVTEMDFGENNSLMKILFDLPSDQVFKNAHHI